MPIKAKEGNRVHLAGVLSGFNCPLEKKRHPKDREKDTRGRGYLGTGSGAFSLPRRLPAFGKSDLSKLGKVPKAAKCEG